MRKEEQRLLVKAASGGVVVALLANLLIAGLGWLVLALCLLGFWDGFLVPTWRVPAIGLWQALAGVLPLIVLLMGWETFRNR